MRKALVVVDYQKDFVSGSLGFPKALELAKPIEQKIMSYLGQGQDVLFTLDTHSGDYLETQEGSKLPVVHCIRGSQGWQVDDSIIKYQQKAVKVFEKPTFGSLELAEYLKEQKYEQVELVGLVSSICVISNAILAKAALPEAEIVVDARCTAGADEALHQKALDVMEGVQITVTNR